MHTYESERCWLAVIIANAFANISGRGREMSAP